MSLKSENMELNVLYHISHLLLHERDVSTLLSEVLDVLRDEMDVRRAIMTLRRGDRLMVEASAGLTPSEKKRAQYKIGEGITGRVAETGEPIVIADIADEPSFLNKTGLRERKGLAFISVPIKHEGKVVGTLSIDRASAPENKLRGVLGFLEILVNILADAVATFRAEIEEKELLKAENERLKRELGAQFKPGGIVGNCGAMRSVYAMIAQVADSPATVLIRGESGTGKELVAKALHYASSRKDAPFIAVNCAALPENLIESELFGHEKGSFTGASAQRKGRFELADGGTLFLDEIGDISLSVQVRLLRVMQERCFERVGGSRQVNVNVRVIAATSRNLEELISRERFREDLYYRLNIFPINLPALRERKSDMMPLADHFLEKYNKIYGKNVRRISTPAINMMMSYHWPGNVRELESCIERAVLMTTNDVITAYALPPSLQTASATNTDLTRFGVTQNDSKAGFETMVASFERELIVDALKNNRGNVAAAARELNATKRVIHYKISKLGIEPAQYK
jgi:Nif-specific regulatory protein